MDDVTCTRSNCSKQSQRLTPTTRNKSNKRLGASTGPSSRLPSERLKTPSEPAGSGHAVCRPDRPQKASTRAWVWERLWERRLELGASTYGVRVPLAPRGLGAGDVGLGVEMPGAPRGMGSDGLGSGLGSDGLGLESAWWP